MERVPGKEQAGASPSDAVQASDGAWTQAGTRRYPGSKARRQKAALRAEMDEAEMWGGEDAFTKSSSKR